MYQTINEYDFTRAFQESDSRKNQFSHDALKAIFAYYEELEESTGEEIEFDLVGVCCDWTEYETALEIIEQYSPEVKLSTEAEALEWLQERTTVLSFDGKRLDKSTGEWVTFTGVVIANF